MPDEKGKYLLPRTPDKGSDPPTFHDWQAREMIAEAHAKRGPKRSNTRKDSRRR